MLHPKLDRRTRTDVSNAALLLATQYTPGWAGAPDPTDPGRRLIDLFGRLAELLLERLNRIPEKNFLAFLEMTGVERFPGAPAGVPVTFLLSKRALQGGEVPQGTQVATTQTQTSDARVFETKNPFFVTPARLDAVVSVLPAANQYVLHTILPQPPTSAALAGAVPVTAFSQSEPGLRQVNHILYLGSAALFGRTDAADVTITLTLASGSFPASGITWLRFDKHAKDWVAVGVPVTPGNPAPSQFTFTFHALTGAAEREINGIKDVWLAARFDGPFAAGFVTPVIAAAQAAAGSPVTPVTQFDAAFTNSEPIDTSKPYLPFGRRPAYGDAFYFGSKTAFGDDVERVDLSFSIRPFAHSALEAQFAGVPDPTTIRTVARWQFLDQAGQWVELGTFDHRFTFTAAGVTQVSNAGPGGAHAAEGAFIGLGGTNLVNVQFSGFQGRIGLRKVNGVESRWLRVLLLSDLPYGQDGIQTAAGFVGPLWISPTIEDMSIVYVPLTAGQPVTNVATLNNFQFERPSGPIAAFTSLASRQMGGLPLFGSQPALYFAFDAPFTQVFISIFFDLAGPQSTLFSPLESGNPNIAWEYWSAAAGWSALDVDDQTFDLTTSGTVGFVGPGNSDPLALFPQLDPAPLNPIPRWWFRARLASGAYDYPPRVKGIYLNTVMSANVSTQRSDVIVGSSSGEPNQIFGLVKWPVLGGEFWVREPERPTAEELAELETEHGTDSSVVEDAGQSEVWVRWRRVPNFLVSGPRSRHYTLEPVAAVVGFGDGTNGLIPPPSKNNIVVRRFQTGGGEAANWEAPPLAVKQLKSSLPFIDKVFNVQSASAGASYWTLDDVGRFGPETIKNRGRAVTTEDYEWMVLQRFSQVARVRCLPTVAPAPGGGLAFQAGAVTVQVAPKGTELRPQPSQGLLRQIREFLAQTALANIGDGIYVKGPDYAEVRVAATLVPLRPELTSVVIRQATAALEAFLHPLTGGEDRSGYAFGRPVYLSEVFAVLERIEGVDHVVSASFIDLPGAGVFPVPSNSLASSGAHLITV
ncbi:MAG: putative baseplate assembly protein [Acidobacteria bacterium]|nr:putative baseplate assembly protein [Acidobacteriota bacterium]